MTTRLIVETPGAAVPSSTAPQDPKVRRMRVLIVVLALAVAWASLPFLPGLFGAGVLAVLGSPAHRVFSRKIGSRTAALCLTLLALVLIAAQTDMVSILPILGSALVWFPGAVVLFLDGRTGAAFILGIIGVVICSNVDNVIRPFIFRRVSGMHPMVSLLGAFAGVKAMGLIGVLVGPLVLTLFLELLALHETELAGNAAGARSSFRAGL